MRYHGPRDMTTSAPLPLKPPQSPGDGAAESAEFAYRAQSVDGVVICGTIESRDADEARWRLAALGLRVLELAPAQRKRRTRAVTGDDFASFNTQLASLAEAGLPLEQGLRLIAAEMRSGRMAASVKLVADELDRGRPLDEAFARHSDKFPPLYGRVLQAGVNCGNLPGVLLSLGAHLQMTQRLRETLWRTLSYPLMVLAGFAAVMVFLGLAVVPPMRDIYQQLAEDQSMSVPEIPLLSLLVFTVADYMPHILLAIGIGLGLAVIGWIGLRIAGRTTWFVERFIVPLPLIGPVLRRSLAARWCDGVRLGIEAGLPLDGAMELASDAAGSERLHHDSRRLAEAHLRGSLMSDIPRLWALSPTVALAMDGAIVRGDLPGTMATLRDMYQQQAEHAMGVMQAALRPVLVVMLAGVLALVVAGLLLPLFNLIDSFMNVGTTISVSR